MHNWCCIRFEWDKNTFGSRVLERITNYVRRFITLDEIWIYHHNLVLKQKAKKLCDPDFRLRNEKLAKKVLKPVFLGAKGILFVDYFQTGKAINLDYYSELLHAIFFLNIQFIEEKII